MFNLRSLLKVNSQLGVFTRLNHGKNNKKFLYKDGKLINGTIYYYPNPNQPEEAVAEPAKLFRVERVKPSRGNPHWERRILRDLGIMERPNFTVVKNIPENNARLWKIKHLLKITAINFPNGEPTEDDVNHTILKENGDCVVIKNLEPLQQRLEAAEKFEKDPKILDGATLRRDTRRKWNQPWEAV